MVGNGSGKAEVVIGGVRRRRGRRFFPYPTSDPQLEFLSISTREEERHIPLYDEAVMTVPDLSVTISYAARGALPYELPPIPSHLQTVTIIPGIILITHEPKERHVHRRHAQLERLKVETEILPKTVEHG